MHLAMPYIFLGLSVLAMAWALLSLWKSFAAAFAAPERLMAEDESMLGQQRRRDLLSEKEALLESIRDLSFEHRARKISDGDFARLDRDLRTRAKDVLREIDHELADFLPEAERLFEKHTADVDAQRVAGSDPGMLELGEDVLQECPECTTANPPEALRCRSCGTRLQPTHCVACGTVNDPDATFCKKCGGRMTSEPPSPPEQEGEGRADKDDPAPSAEKGGEPA